MLNTNILKKAKIDKYDFWQKLVDLRFIDEIILFGSRSRGDFKEKSDIDIAIKCSNHNSNEWLKISEIIDQTDTLLDIDYINIDRTDEAMLKNINKDKKIIYKKND